MTSPRSRSWLAIIALLIAPAVLAQAQELEQPVSIVTGSGEQAEMDELIAAVLAADVVFLGEQHDDLVGQSFQLRVLQEAIRLSAKDRPLVLGLEMFERDVQIVLDEYLQGAIRERDFMAAARPWRNYEESYRPLVETAREHGVPVAATNVPGRYANLVARSGMPALDSLPPASRAWLPQSPVAPASSPLADDFRHRMEAIAHAHGPDMEIELLLEAQNLRDASMAEVIAGWLGRQPGTLLIHVNGSFHSANGRGIPEHLLRLNPELRVVTITLYPGLDEEVFAAGDHFIVDTAQDKQGISD